MVQPLSDSHEEHVASVDALQEQLRERRTARKARVARLKETCYRALSDTPSSGYKLPPPSPQNGSGRAAAAAPPPPPPPAPAAEERSPYDTQELEAELVRRQIALAERQDERRDAVQRLKKTAMRTVTEIKTSAFTRDELGIEDIDVDEITGD